MKYTLRQLDVFLAVAHYQNVSKAAESLSMSQSACSSALKDLEQQYDIQLFDRAGKRLQTNETGRRLRPHAEALITQARELEKELLQRNQAGQITVGATLTIGNYLCVGLIKEFVKKEPQAQVKLEVANTTSIANKLLNFDIDIGMIEGEINHPDLQMLPWLDDELVCFCAHDHPLAKQGTLSREDILQTPWILREHGSGTRQVFERGMHNLLPNLNILLELEHTEAIKRAVEAGMGISCLSKIALADALKRKSLAALKTPGHNFQRKLYLVVHKHKYRSAGIQHWLDLCQSET